MSSLIEYVLYACTSRTFDAAVWLMFFRICASSLYEDIGK